MSMFCYQCEQTAKGTGCTKVGVCGKGPDVAALQDLLIYTLKGVGFWATLAREKGASDEKINVFTVEGLFSTLSNVDFDGEEIARLVRKSVEFREQAKALYEKANDGPYTGKIPAAAAYQPSATTADLVTDGIAQGLLNVSADEDIKSIREIIMYGMKGMSAYADHAAILGHTDESVFAYIHKALAAMLDDSIELMDYVGLAMECGQANFKCMEVLNQANTGAYGHPVPTPVNLGTKAGKGILVSGHDLKMLEEILKQTEGKGINIYTHGEMIPAHGYPELKKYSHLVANYGGAWQDQAKELPAFPGAIIFNTNCILRPADSYKDRLFTWGLVQWPDVTHINGWDFSAVIEKALECPSLEEKADKDILVGFGHNAVLGVADKVIEAVKAGDIKHFFLVGGCDGAKSGRNYYTDFAEKAPKDTVILTVACGKYRFNKLDLGDIGGIPRLLDVGQCNDSYSAIQIALALANAFECDVNELPLSLVLSWYEQKAVVVLLTLLSLGIKNIKLGPTLPAFISPNILNYLVENFNIGPIGESAEADLAEILG